MAQDGGALRHRAGDQRGAEGADGAGQDARGQARGSARGLSPVRIWSGGVPARHRGGRRVGAHGGGLACLRLGWSRPCRGGLHVPGLLRANPGPPLGPTKNARRLPSGVISKASAAGSAAAAGPWRELRDLGLLVGRRIGVGLRAAAALKESDTAQTGLSLPILLAPLLTTLLATARAFTLAGPLR